MRRGRRLLNALATAAMAVLVLAIAALVVVPRVAPVRVYSILTGSMAPAIPVGSLVIATAERADQVRPGQVIVFQRPDRPSVAETHRVLAVIAGAEGPEVTTKGDANPVPDPWTLRLGGTGWRVVAVVPFAGWLFIVGSTPLFRFALLVVPAALLVAWVLRALWRPAPPAAATAA